LSETIWRQLIFFIDEPRHHAQLAATAASIAASSRELPTAEHLLVAQEAQVSARLGAIEADVAYFRSRLAGVELSIASLSADLEATRAELTSLRACNPISRR
jgi:multidrug resistance efflux pump